MLNVDFMTGYTFTPCVGYFTSPGTDTKLKGLTDFSGSSKRHWQSGINGIAIASEWHQWSIHDIGYFLYLLCSHIEYLELFLTFQNNLYAKMYYDFMFLYFDPLRYKIITINILLPA